MTIVAALATVAARAGDDCGSLPIYGNAPPLGAEHQVDRLAAPTPYDVYEPQIAADGSGGVAHAWLEAIFGDASSHRILCRGSFDHGHTLTPLPVRVDDTPAPYGFSDLRLSADSGGRVYAIWKHNVMFTGQAEIWFSRSLDGGNSWEPDRRIDHAPVLVGITSAPEIAAIPSGHVYVAWSDTRLAGRWRVFLQRSEDFGATWADEDLRVDHNETASNRSEHPRLAVTGAGGVYVVWEDNRQSANSVYFNGSTDDGATFMEQDVHVDSLPPGSAYLVEGPVIAAAAGGSVHVAWRDLRNGNYQAWYNRSGDHGATFDGDRRIDHGPTGIHTHPVHLACDDGGRVYGLWTYAAPGPFVNVSKLWLNRSTDQGVTWGDADTRLDQSPDTHHAHFGRVGADGSGNVFVAWVQEVFCSPPCANAQDVWCAVSLDHGATVEPAVRLDGAPANTNQGLPGLAVGGCGVAHASWRDNRNHPGAGDPLVNLYARGFAAQPPCPADLDGDGTVAVADLLALLGAWGPNPGHPADLDGDGSVAVPDLLVLLAAWGPCP